jgi:hypothetical protein
VGEDKVTSGVAVFVGARNVEYAESDDTEDGGFSDTGRRESCDSLEYVTVQGAVWRT